MGQGTGEANALYWLRRGEHVWVLRRPPAVIKSISVWDTEVRDGLPSRTELAARYADRTGAGLSALAYYQALTLFKLTINLESSVARLSCPDAGGDGGPADPLCGEFHAGHWADCDRLSECVYGRFGRCDVLVNLQAIGPARSRVSR